MCVWVMALFFFFNDTATTEIYTLSYTTLFRSSRAVRVRVDEARQGVGVSERHRRRGPRLSGGGDAAAGWQDRKSTRLNSSHSQISYAVFCLKKKKNNTKTKHHNARHAAADTPG